MRNQPAARVVALVAVITVVLTGCFTGQRGHLSPSATTVSADTAVSDPAIAAVLAKLDTATDDAYTATYSILLRFGSVTTAATVAQTTAQTRSITIGTVRYLDQGGLQQTCDVTTAVCSDGLDDSKISNAVPSHDFYRTAAAARLRQDAATMTSAGIASTREIAGRSATCVQVTFAQGTKSYCVLDNGLLAYQDTPDVQIDLSAIADAADATLFTPTTVAG
jgi:hypothetical protein